MASPIPAMTDTERLIVAQAVKARFGKDVPIENVETEIRLHNDHYELTLCPGFYWLERGCHFVLSKTGESRYRSLFFYRVDDRFATGHEEYDDIGECATLLMQMQADEEAKRLGESADSNN